MYRTGASVASPSERRHSSVTLVVFLHSTCLCASRSEHRGTLHLRRPPPLHVTCDHYINITYHSYFNCTEYFLDRMFPRSCNVSRFLTRTRFLRLNSTSWAAFGRKFLCAQCVACKFRNVAATSDTAWTSVVIAITCPWFMWRQRQNWRCKSLLLALNRSAQDVGYINILNNEKDFFGCLLP